MKVPINWLKEYVTLPSDLVFFADKLTAIGHMQDHPPQEIAGDVVMDLEVRQNRSDCLSLWGLAREAGAVLQTPVRFPELKKLPPVSTKVQAVIEAKELCYRFHTLRFDGIKIAPSPKWLAQKLEAYGMKSINNLVDITNFVMIEVGQPLHAFDVNSLSGEKLIIRAAKKGEVITVLGNKKFQLDPADLVIADAEKALALGGVIGGIDSGISDTTTSIILEAATYNQATVRRSTLRHSIRTEASLRHEKFLHPDLTEVALARAAELIIDLCKATLVEHSDAYTEKFAATTVELDMNAVKNLGGIEIEKAEAIKILTSLGITCKNAAGTKIETVIPYFRTDLEQEADLIEEILRIYGYDKIAERLPQTSPPKDIQAPSYIAEEKVRNVLTACGFDEQITEPLTKEAVSMRSAIYLQNSLNSEKIMLRTTLKNGLVSVLNYQRKLKKGDITLYEVGRIYFMDGKKYVEKKVIGGVCSGKKITYAQVKGIVEVVFDRSRSDYTEEAVTIELLAGESVPTFYFEIDTELLMKHNMTNQNAQILTSLPQVILQDFSLVCPPDVKVGDLLNSVRDVSPLIYKVELGELPRTLDEKTKAVFLRIQYHSPKKTLSNEDVMPIREKILGMLKEKYAAVLR